MSVMIWLARLLAVFRKPKLDEVLNEDIRSHLEMAAEENLRRGMNLGEAREIALRKFGHLEPMKEQYRDARGIPVIESVLRDFRFAIRTLRRSPSFTAVAILTLAIGIGAATSTSAFLYEMLLRPLPYQAPEELVMLWTTIPDQGIDQDGSSYLNIQDWKEQNRSFTELALVSRDESGTLLGGEDPVPIKVAKVSANLFPVLGVSPSLGRTFSQTEEDLRERVVVLSHAFWLNRFGGSPAAIGATIELEGGSSQVIGVMPPEFRFPSKDIQLWTPHTLASYWPRVKDLRASDLYKVVARLRPGATAETAQEEMDVLVRQIENQSPDALQGMGVQVVALREQMTGQNLPLALSILFVAVIGMLLIACANVAGLLLARGFAREREFALRTAIGAGRARLIQQLLLESLVLALIAGICGVGLASFTIRVVSAILPLDLPHVETVGLDASVVAFSFGLALLTVVACGTIPALRLSVKSPNDVLKAGGRLLAGGASNKSRRLFVVVELAMATALLIGTGLLLRSFMNVRQTDPGFQTKNVTRTRVALPSSYNSVGSAAFFREALERLENLPGVTSAGAIHELFFQYNPDTSITVEGHAPGRNQPIPQLIGDAISGDYFRAMGVPLMQGRLFTDQDGPSSPRVAIINETMAQEFFRGQNPVGKRFVLGTPNPAGKNDWITVVGVVGDMRRQGLETPVIAQMFGPHAQPQTTAWTLSSEPTCIPTNSWLRCWANCAILRKQLSYRAARSSSRNSLGSMPGGRSKPGY